MLARSLFAIPFLSLCLTSGCKPRQDSLDEETQRVAAWRQQRLANLTSENGWLTLAGLYWLKQGSNSFGRDGSNDVALDHPAIPDKAGMFELHGTEVRFTAAPGSGVTLHGLPADRKTESIKLATDVAGEPTVLALGPLRFYAIERAGKFGVRIRDIDHPARNAFAGLDYFPVSIDWRIHAHYEPYLPSRHIAILNVLGMTEQMESPGALVFEKDDQIWRLDTILESPTDTELFVMFTDATSGRESYGAGRYLYVPIPTGERVWLDFNQAYNPPCAFSDFATCPLPPRQNRLSLAITAGERKYTRH